MNRAILFTSLLAALATASCASSNRFASFQPPAIEPISLEEDFFAPLSLDEASRITLLPQDPGSFTTISATDTPSPGFFSLGAGDALGVRIHLSDRILASAPITLDLTEVPTD